MILPLTKNSAEIFRDYLRRNITKKVPEVKTNSNEIFQVFHWNSLFTDILIKGNDLSH